MKIGIIISTNEPETVWNAFRFGVILRKVEKFLSIVNFSGILEIKTIAKYSI